MTRQESLLADPSTIKVIYRAQNTDTALLRLEEVEAEWGKALSGDRPGLAPGLGLCRAVFCVCARQVGHAQRFLSTHSELLPVFLDSDLSDRRQRW